MEVGQQPVWLVLIPSCEVVGGGCNRTQWEGVYWLAFLSPAFFTALDSVLSFKKPFPRGTNLDWAFGR